MKKSILYICLGLLLLLGACSEKDDGQDNANAQAGEKSPETVNTDGTDETDADAESKEDGELEGEPAEEKEAQEEPAVPLYELNNIYSVVPIDDADPKVVLLTFDDAPDKRALDIAKTLKEMDAPAIFFVNGHFIQTEEKQDILKEIHDMGFMIGNHTKTHANLSKLTEEEQKEEIISVNEDVEKITGEKPKFFRAPFGVNTDYSRSLAEQEGMVLMNWSYGYDFMKDYMTKEKIADIMVNTELLGNGANLLMHDREWTADALEEIITGLRGKGYGFVDPHTIKVIGDK